MTVDSKIKKKGRDSHADLKATLALVVAEKFEEVSDDDDDDSVVQFVQRTLTLIKGKLLLRTFCNQLHGALTLEGRNL